MGRAPQAKTVRHTETGVVAELIDQRIVPANDVEWISIDLVEMVCCRGHGAS